MTVSTGVLASGTLVFDPPLPPDVEDSIHALPMGLAMKVALRANGPDRLDLPLHCSIDRRVAHSGLPLMPFQCWPFGRDYVQGWIGGGVAWDLARAGEAAAIDYALSQLRELFGGRVDRLFAGGGSLVTHWDADPWIRGAYCYAVPGQSQARDRLGEPLAGGHLMFAGEACSVPYAGTLAGAWISGQAAAHAIPVPVRSMVTPLRAMANRSLRRQPPISAAGPQGSMSGLGRGRRPAHGVNSRISGGRRRPGWRSGPAELSINRSASVAIRLPRLDRLLRQVVEQKRPPGAMLDQQQRREMGIDDSAVRQMPRRCDRGPSVHPAPARRSDRENDVARPDRCDHGSERRQIVLPDMPHRHQHGHPRGEQQQRTDRRLAQTARRGSATGIESGRDHGSRHDDEARVEVVRPFERNR